MALRLVVDNTRPNWKPAPTPGLTLADFEAFLRMHGYALAHEEGIARCYARESTYVVVNDEEEVTLGGAGRSEPVDVGLVGLTPALLADLAADTWGARAFG